MRKLHLIAIAGLLVGGAFWFGRSSSHETAQAQPEVVTPAPVAAPAPQRTAKLPPIAPTLHRRSEPAPGLAADLAAADPKIRRAAVREVTQNSDPDPQLLLAAAKDPDIDVGLAAMAGLAKLYSDGRVSTDEMARRALDRGTSAKVRSSALNALGAVPNLDAAQLLVKLLDTGDVLERRAAAALLGNQDMAIAVPALIHALADADEYVRGNALESLKLRSRGRDFGIDAAAWQAWWQRSR